MVSNFYTNSHSSKIGALIALLFVAGCDFSTSVPESLPEETTADDVKDKNAGDISEPEPEPGPADPDVEATDPNGTEPEPEPEPEQMPEPVEPITGILELLTYNVAGLPLGLSSADPGENTQHISPLLNNFDLALVQEDFGYHEDLAAEATHTYQSTPMESSGADSLGDGLNRFSKSAFTSFERVEWEECNGYVMSKNDCLTPKGFSFARHVLAEGTELDIYNMHFDAGRDEGDVQARNAQVAQLVEFIADRSADRSVLVVGDTNMKESDAPTLASLMDGAGLTDACQFLACSEPHRIDRVLFRNANGLTLEPTSWAVDNTFVDAQQEPLSDHEPVRVQLSFVAGGP